MSISFYSKTVRKANSNKCRPESVWKINDTTNWDLFAGQIKSTFSCWQVNKSKTVNENWNEW